MKTLMCTIILVLLAYSSAEECDILDTPAFTACVEAAEAKLLFDMEEFTKDHCNTNHTKDILVKAREGAIACVDKHLITPQCKATGSEQLKKKHAQVKLLIDHAAQRINDLCEGGAEPICGGLVMKCIMDNTAVQKYIALDDNSDDDDDDDDEDATNSTESVKKVPEHVFKFLFSSDVTKEDEYKKLCDAQAADKDSDFKKAIQCMKDIPSTCKVDLSAFIHDKTEHYPTMLAIVFQMQYFACSDGCKNPDLPERITTLDGCISDDIKGLTPADVPALNGTVKTKYCTSANEFSDCLEKKSKSCPYTTRLASEQLASEDDFIEGLRKLLTTENCPDAQTFTKLQELINALDSEATDVTGSGMVLRYTSFMLIGSLLAILLL